MAKKRNSIDTLQGAAEIAGVVDPSGIVDAGNAIVYAARGMLDPKRRKEHFSSAAISAAGILPYVGDLAKLSRFGGKAGAHAATTGAKGATGASRGHGFADALKEAGLGSKGSGGRPGQSSVLAKGSNFGDVLSGLKSPGEAREEVETQVESEKVQQRLIETTKALTGVFGTLTLGTVGLTKAIHAFGAGIVARQAADLRDLSPAHASTAAHLEASRLGRRVGRGAATGDTFEDLAEAVNGLEQTIEPYLVVGINTLQVIATAATKMADGTIKLVQDGVKRNTVLDEMWEIMKGWIPFADGDENSPAYLQLLDDLQSGRYRGGRFLRRRRI